MRRIALAAACLLAAPVLPAQATELGNAVESACTYVYKSVPDSYDILVVLVAEAHATGPDPVLATTVTCVLTNAYHDPNSLQNQIVAQTTVPGPHAYTVSSGVIRWGSPEMCGDSSAQFLSGISTTRVDEPKRCRQVGT